jgi:hypothetical protein
MPGQTFALFDEKDLELTRRLTPDEPMPPELADKIETLRRALSQYPEFQVSSFKRHLLRRGDTVATDHVVFSPPQKHAGHWYSYSMGGEFDQVHLNIGMWPTHFRVGLGFAVGQSVKSALPAFRQFQGFLGMRPPLMFRDAFYKCVKRNNFGLEDSGLPYWGDAHDILMRLETYVAPDAKEAGILLVVGSLWKSEVLARKTVADMRKSLRELLPFYEALVLMAGRFQEVEEF